MKNTNLKKLVLISVAVLAWAAFAERPTTRKLGTALRSTLPLL